MKYVLVFVIGFALSGIMYGLTVLLQILCAKKNCFRLQGFCMPAVGLVLAVPVIIYFDILPFNFDSLSDWKMWALAAGTAIISGLFVQLSKREKSPSESLLLSCAEGAAMEIVQRIMMQTFVLGLLMKWGLESAWCIVINAFIFCADIFVAAMFAGGKNIKKLVIEAAASVIFSFGIGYVFYIGGCFVIPMLAHAAERLLSGVLEARRTRARE